MKLFYIPGACSFGPHIALRELGLPFELERVRFVDARSREEIDILQPGARERGYDVVFGPDATPFRQVNPKGFVPTLQLDDGAILTEGPAIYQYLADIAPESGFAPALRTPQRAIFVQYISEVAEGVHKKISLAMHSRNDFVRATILDEVLATLDRFAARLAGNDFLLDRFSFADVYLFMNWTVASNVARRPPSTWPNAAAYLDRVRARPSVRSASRIEGTEARFLAPSL